MKTFKQMVSESDDGFDTITIKCRDREGVIKKLIQYCGDIGNVGHSFSIVVDPGSDTEKSFGWDGDGSTYLKSVK